jgi:hypothetical protein
VRIAVGDGVIAARTALRILQLQLDEQIIFQKYWLCKYASLQSSRVAAPFLTGILLQVHSLHVMPRASAQHCANAALWLLTTYLAKVALVRQVLPRRP